jgi:2-isopropylmalate synthase
VFGLDRAGTIDLAVRAAAQIRQLAERQRETAIAYQYSPESFTGTELDFALEICEAVFDVFEPTPERPLILNLPSTVEMSTPNVFADQIEWFGRNLRRRDCVVLSVHPHNDRGCGVAAAELALLAGADRIEGTLFGNGERTGNVDLVTLALNLYSQGISPGLDLSQIDRIVSVVEECNRLPVHPRHPYAGSLVYTAFSGTHQDAIRKGFAARERSRAERWEVPYLPIDPADVGRGYEAVVRINSQSGKGGIAFVLEREHGIELPRAFQLELRDAVQAVADRSESELGPDEIWSVFRGEYLDARAPLTLLEPKTFELGDTVHVRATARIDGRELDLEGEGASALEALASALSDTGVWRAELIEHTVQRLAAAARAGAETERTAVFATLRTAEGTAVRGAGIHADPQTAHLEAVVSAFNRAARAAR